MPLIASSDNINFTLFGSSEEKKLINLYLEYNTITTDFKYSTERRNRKQYMNSVS